MHSKKEFTLGFVLLALFFVVLFSMFMPLWNGHNAMAYLDNLYNSISKGSAYYIPEMRIEAEKKKGTLLDLTVSMKNQGQAQSIATVLQQAGITADAQGEKVHIRGDYGTLLSVALDDSDVMYANNGAALQKKYPAYAQKDERQVLYDWHTLFESLDKNLKKQEKFADAKTAFAINSKVVETAYNYYKVQAEKVRDKAGIVFFSLTFYVVYTMWYGFAILFLFEGWGLKISH